MLTYMSSWYNHLIIMITNNYDNHMGCYGKARPDQHTSSYMAYQWYNRIWKEIVADG